MDCLICKSDEIIITLNGVIICRNCLTILNDHCNYYIDTYDDKNITYIKKLWYQLKNYIINIINHING